MRIVMAILSVVVLTGCGNTNKLPRAANPADRTAELSPEKKESIRQLVEGSDIIVLGKVVRVYDGRARDGGMSYDIELEKQLYGKSISNDSFRFRSSGQIGYATYKEEERVLLFLKHWQEEIIQVTPVCYISKQAPRRGLTLWPLQSHLDFIETEIAQKK